MIKLYFGGPFGYVTGGGTRGGAAFGLPPTLTGLDAYCELMDGSTVPWSVAVIGGDLFAHRAMALEALARGAHLHVGIEDYAGDETPTNVELVEQAVALCKEAGRPVATIAEAEAILDLPQTRRVGTTPRVSATRFTLAGKLNSTQPRPTAPSGVSNRHNARGNRDATPSGDWIITGACSSGVSVRSSDPMRKVAPVAGRVASTV